MPELRQNMATKEWVIIATERAHRPEQFRIAAQRTVDLLPAWDERCPFCPGQEEPELEVMRMDGDGEHPWGLRVVRNKYPALVPEGDRLRSFDGVRRSLTGVGHHEVVIETPVHNSCPALETEAEVLRTLQAFQIRGRQLREDPRIDHTIFFKNHGVRAGSSLVHPHAQIIALPVVPYNIRSRVEEARRFFEDTGACVYCRMLEAELEAGERVVEETAHFVAFLPYAAYSPFHLWIVPKRHHGSFLTSTTVELNDLARLLRRTLRRLYFGLNDPDYNYVLRSAPPSEERFEYMHWYVSVVPRVSRAAGFELGSGMFINSALPEESAAFLRAQDPTDLAEGERIFGLGLAADHRRATLAKHRDDRQAARARRHHAGVRPLGRGHHHTREVSAQRGQPRGARAPRARFAQRVHREHLQRAAGRVDHDPQRRVPTPARHRLHDLALQDRPARHHRQAHAVLRAVDDHVRQTALVAALQRGLLLGADVLEQHDLRVLHRGRLGGEVQRLDLRLGRRVTAADADPSAADAAAEERAREPKEGLCGKSPVSHDLAPSQLRFNE